MTKVSRNARCPCGSGKKYKHCCAGKAAESIASPMQQVPSIGQSVSATTLAATLALIIIGTTAAYWSVLGFGFVNHDDILYVTNNSYVQKGLTGQNLVWAITSTEAANWHPLTWISHMLDVSIYGFEDASGHHLTNLGLHVINSCLLFVLLIRYTGKPVPSALVAAFFALHPMHVESVAWVSERKDVLSTLFALLTLWFYHRYAITQHVRSYSIMFLFFCLGLMSKPMLISLPLLMVLLDFWPLQRFSCFGPGQSKSVFTSCIRNLVLSARNKIPLFAAAIFSAVMTLVAQGGSGAIGSVENFSIPVRLANSVLSYSAYIGKTLWPLDLSAFYPYRSTVVFWQWTLALAFLLAITWLVLKVWRRAPAMTVGWLWYVISLIPVIGIVQVGNQAMADRYMYLPHIGLFILIFFGVPELFKTRNIKPGIMLLPIILLLLACSILTYKQVQTWKDTLSLFSHATSVNPRNAFAQFALGGEYLRQDQLDKAEVHLLKSVEIKQDYPDAYDQLGIVYARKGDPVKALHYFREAYNRAPNADARRLQNLAVALRDNGQLDEAESTLRKALQLNPTDSKIHYNLGVVQYRSKQFPEARDSLLMALNILKTPRQSSSLVDAALNENSHAVPLNVHAYLALVYEQLGQFEAALKHHQAVFDLNPGNPQSSIQLSRAHQNFGVELANQKRYPGAVEHFRNAIIYHPQNEEAKLNLEKVEQLLRTK
jgi:tetratricopeptide (TPR) repeat protein